MHPDTLLTVEKAAEMYSGAPSEADNPASWECWVGIAQGNLEQEIKQRRIGYVVWMGNILVRWGDVVNARI